MPGRRTDPFDVLVIVGVLVGVVLLAGVVIMMIRSRLLRSEGGALQDAGSLLEGLRAMRDRGQMSQDEYDAARLAIRERAAASLTGTGTPPSSSSGTGSPKPRPTPGQGAAPPGETRIASPGFDLTGRPLPRPANPEE